MGFAMWVKSENHEKWQMFATFAACDKGSSAMDAEMLAAMCLVYAIALCFKPGLAPGTFCNAQRQDW